MLILNINLQISNIDLGQQVKYQLILLVSSQIFGLGLVVMGFRITGA